jgi:hypothetical protein
MKYSKYFGAKRRGFIKSESNLAPRGACHFKSENIRCDIFIVQATDLIVKYVYHHKQAC